MTELSEPDQQSGKPCFCACTHCDTNTHALKTRQDRLFGPADRLFYQPFVSMHIHSRVLMEETSCQKGSAFQHGAKRQCKDQLRP